jgi:hypothetical protein
MRGALVFARRWIAFGLVSTFERPAPDIDKIVEAWQIWTAGGEDVLPGRTMADLKIGGVDLMLATLAEDTEQVRDAAEAWQSWEKGRVSPEDTLATLTSTGFGDIVGALAEPA